MEIVLDNTIRKEKQITYIKKKTDHHDNSEILLKVALKTIKQTNINKKWPPVIQM